MSAFFLRSLSVLHDGGYVMYLGALVLDRFLMRLGDVVFHKGRFMKSFFLFRWLGVVVCFALCLNWQTVEKSKCYAQQEVIDSSPLFVPSTDVDSPIFFSSIDAARRNRPPRPAKTRENLFYPDGFLTLSSPESEKSVGIESQGGELQIVPESFDKPSVVLNPLDPAVETTPSVIPQVSFESDNKRGDNVLFWVISITLAGLGLFLYYDYRYRNQLKNELVHNAKLCSVNAVSSDFDEVLAKAPDMTDPRAPSYVDPSFDPYPLDFGEQYLPSHGCYSYRNEVNGLPEVAGAGLEEENMDFVPRGAHFSRANSEIVEDFVVDENKSV